jgi:hypothetical protein
MARSHRHRLRSHGITTEPCPSGRQSWQHGPQGLTNVRTAFGAGQGEWVLVVTGTGSALAGLQRTGVNHIMPDNPTAGNAA